MDDPFARATFPIGVSKAPEVYPADLKPVESKLESAKGTLNELTKDFVLYTHAILFTHGGMQYDPVPLFFAELKLPADAAPYVIGLDTPELVDLPPPWNSILFAARHETWKIIAAMLDMLAGVDRPNKRFWRTLRQEVPITDVWALRRHEIVPSPVPTALINVVGLDGNDSCLHFAPPTSLPGPLRLIVDKPLKETVALARSIMSADGSDNKLRKFLNEQLQS